MIRETKTKDGKVLTRTSTGYWTELYTLSDGREITAEELALRLETTSHTARARLNKSSDPNKIFRSVKQINRSGNDRVDSNWMDGKTWYKDPLVKLMLK